MLENRSFDSMLGALYPPSRTFDGLTGAEFNLDSQGVAIPARNIPGSDQITMSTPNPDPGQAHFLPTLGLIKKSHVRSFDAPPVEPALLGVDQCAAGSRNF
jgi:hypothetical protein